MFNFFKKKTQEKPKKRNKKVVYKRNFGLNNRFLSDWSAPYGVSPSKEVLSKLSDAIGASRSLCREVDYINGFMNKIPQNILSPSAKHQGLKLQNKAKLPDSTLDTKINDFIEKAWNNFCKKGNCDVTGSYSMAEIVSIIAKTRMRDGTVFIRRIKKFKNRYNYAVQILNIDYLDINLNKELKINRIIGGVEVNKWGAPVAYHFLSDYPLSDSIYSSIDEKHMRIPKREIIAFFTPDRAEQYHGFPDVYSSLMRMRMLTKFEESVAIAARASANNMLFISQDIDAPNYDAENAIDETEIDEEYEFYSETEAGVIVKLPPGQRPESYNPSQPNNDNEAFIKQQLKAASSGLGMDYIEFGNDPGEANFASRRGSVLSTRDMWVYRQNELISNILETIFEDWLEIQLLYGRVSNKTIADIDDLNKPSFIGKRWADIDPLKDAKGREINQSNDWTTKIDEIINLGGDPEEIARNKELSESYFGKSTQNEYENLGESEDA